MCIKYSCLQEVVALFILSLGTTYFINKLLMMLMMMKEIRKVFSPPLRPRPSLSSYIYMIITKVFLFPNFMSCLFLFIQVNQLIYFIFETLKKKKTEMQQPVSFATMFPTRFRCRLNHSEFSLLRHCWCFFLFNCPIGLHRHGTY
jgi:hypothetical protein